METSITLFELLSVAGTVGVVVIGAWVHMKVTVAELKTQLNQARKDIDEEKHANKENFTKLFDKIDELKDLILKK